MSNISTTISPATEKALAEYIKRLKKAGERAIKAEIIDAAIRSYVETKRR